MMSHMDSLVHREQYKDLLREAEQERLIRTAELQHSDNWRLYQRVVDWIGAQMISWGCKLQSYGATSSASGPQVAGCQ